MNRPSLLRLLTIGLTVLTLAACAWAQQPRNIILMVGDGMGFEHLKATSLYATGQEGGLFIDSLPFKAEMATTPAGPAGAITDSAAAATALATGRKVRNGVLSLAMPGDGAELKTALEYFKQDGKLTGLVTTTNITDATPAAFGAHINSRRNGPEIMLQYLSRSKPNVLFGGGAGDGDGQLAKAAGYACVTNREELKALDGDKVTHIAGFFGLGNMPFEYNSTTSAPAVAYEDLPHLSEMAKAALSVLAKGEKGFFLLVEGGMIDKAGHGNMLAEMVFETLEFDNAVKEVLTWAESRSDTLVIVCADHETGGLKVLENQGKGKLPEVAWSTGGHTGTNVPAYAWGQGAEKVKGVIDNTDLFEIMTGLPKPPAWQPPATAPATMPVAPPATSSVAVPAGAGQ